MKFSHRGLSSSALPCPFLRALPAESHTKIPKDMLDFHMKGGICKGPLLVERYGLIGNILATLGRLPTPTPPGVSPSEVVVKSKICPETNALRWVRQFPASPVMESEWYYDEKEQLAVDSFDFLGIRKFASFGLKLVPIDAPHTPTTGYQGFQHLSSKMWVMGIPIPPMLAMTADGLSLPHEDGKGWRVEVLVEHPLLGKIVSYTGDVRLE
jgi:hypothetical protein